MGAAGAAGALALLVALPAGAAEVSGGCAGMRGGELVFSAAPGCAGQLRADPALRGEVAQTIHAQVGGGGSGVGGGGSASGGRSGAGRGGSLVAPLAAAQPAQAQGSQRQQGLSHPLARLSMLNAQSRYLWQLSNGSRPYFGESASR